VHHTISIASHHTFTDSEPNQRQTQRQQTQTSENQPPPAHKPSQTKPEQTSSIDRDRDTPDQTHQSPQHISMTCTPWDGIFLTLTNKQTTQVSRRRRGRVGGRRRQRRQRWQGCGRVWECEGVGGASGMGPKAQAFQIPKQQTDLGSDT
jgi:hypothetical protein